MQSLSKGQLPGFALIKQKLNSHRIENLHEAVKRELERVRIQALVKPGQRIAITAGSRGISNIVAITRTIVEEIKALGGKPFVVPSMGSHGGATSEGQVAVLRGYGLTEESVGCPILSSMEAVEIGATETGCPVFCDKLAYESDGIIVLNRVKPHSILTGELGSGLMKMLALGLGKKLGADAIHTNGLAKNLLPAARLLIRKAPVVLGMTVVENSMGETAHIEAVPPEEMETADLRLLKLARSYMPDIPFDPLDVLIVREMGKDISGAGMDPNIIGMHRRIGGPPQREIKRIVVLDLTEASHGNAIGVGMADIITERLKEKIDYEATYTNAITSDFLWGVKIPIALPTDQKAIELAFRPFDPKVVRTVLIQNTSHLETMYISEGLLTEARANPNLALTGDMISLAFDSSGHLLTQP
ncbi:MAG: DUF2088 domain-containing protein [Chloroflexi bacterium]|nr:DUF2088 domain-containing protein [Chloroflexota bacterium]